MHGTRSISPGKCTQAMDADYGCRLWRVQQARVSYGSSSVQRREYRKHIYARASGRLSVVEKHSIFRRIKAMCQGKCLHELVPKT